MPHCKKTANTQMAHLDLPDKKWRPFAKLKEPFLSTHHQNVEKSLPFFKVIKTDFITFDTIVKKFNSRCKQKT